MPAPRQPDVVETIPLLLQESEGNGSPFNDDGTVNVVVIRPGQARGRGKRVYPREVLEAHHGFFKGLPMFDNHESPAVKKLRQGFPRPTSDLRGEIRETSWDPDFTTPQDEAMGHDRGAVIGKAMPTKDMRELIEAVPNAIKLSVRTFASGVHRGEYRGKPAELVEGFDAPEESSVDFVTRAGAGGHVLALAEADYDREHGEAERTLSGLGDDELRFHLAEHRPHLLEAAAPDDEDLNVPDDKLTLEEALADPKFSVALEPIIEAQVNAKVAAAMTTGRQEIEESVRAESRRAIEVRDLHSEAVRLIEESKLPPTFRDDLKLRYRLVVEESDGSVRPSPALDVHAEKDADGAVKKPALKVLEEALTADIGRERVKLAEARPTTVRGQGSSTVGDGGEPGHQPSSRQRGRASFASGLRAAGVDTRRLTGTPAKQGDE